MRRILATAALSLLLVGLGALQAEADRVGPFCFSVTPGTPFSFPALLLEVFVDPEPYGQIHLGTARTLNTTDSPSFVTAHVVGRFVRISIVGSFFLKPSFILGGQIDTQAVPPSGEVTITLPDDQTTVIGTITIVACP